MFGKVTIVIISLSIGGCISIGGDEKEQQPGIGERTVSYDSNKDSKSLTVPPDLTDPEITDVVPLPNAEPSESQTILASSEDIEVFKKDQRRWLLVNKKPDDVWLQAKDFIKSHGFSIKKSIKKIGLIETETLARNEGIPEQALGTIRSMLQSTLGTRYALPVVDKYRIRIEPVEGGQKSEVYLSLTSMEEIIIDKGERSERRMWQSHPKDYNLEAEMLYRLMTFLGSDEAKAKDKFLAAKEQQTIKVDLVGGTGGYAKLVFHIDEKETWNSVGWALDELNVDIDDKDVKERSFYIDVARTEDKGFFSSIFGDEAIKKTFQILVRRKDNNVTEVFFNDLTEENEQETIDFSHDFLGSIANLF